MTNKLYVANLPAGTTEDAVRRHFATCGGVADVELGSVRGKGTRGLARVTMTSPAYAAAAVEKLDRASFEGSLLRVSDSPIHAETRATTVRIVQQFRERANMAYDLDCAGTPLTIRVFPIEDERWRVEARSTDAVDAVVVIASAATRRDALGAALRQWNERASSSGPSIDVAGPPTSGNASQCRKVDADGCLRAMSDIRAV